MTITWRSQLDTGNTRIDNDHKRLFELINAVELSLEGKRGGDLLAKALDSLYDYTNYHFEREERILGALDYEDLEAHQKAHEELKTQLVEVRSKIVAAAGANESVPEVERKALAQLLRNWLVEHIVGMDLPFKPYMLKAGPGYTGEE